MHAWSLPRRRGRFLLATLVASLPFSTAAASVSDPRAAAAPRALAIPFAANYGQFDRRVAFSAATPGETVFVTRDGRIVHSLRPPIAQQGSSGWTLTESFVGGHAHPLAGSQTPTKISRFLGDDSSKWSRDEKTYGSVELGNVWPGIEVSLDTTAGAVERVFRIAPGASEKEVSVQIAGATSLTVNPDASLSARTGLGDVTLTPPVAYQEDGRGRRIPVAVSYRAHGNRYGFRLGPHDPRRATVIDPMVRATYLGGSADDTPNGIAVNFNSGDVLVVGVTGSTDFPGTTGGAQTSKGGGSVDSFIARLSGDLETLSQVTYLGGSGNDYALDILVHPSTGEVVVLGVTVSADLPGAAGGARGYGGNGDYYVARLSADLTTLFQSTYFGGSAGEAGYPEGGIAVDVSTGDILICGDTGSNDLPGTTNKAQPSSGGGYDAFVARFSSDLTTLVAATYFGGSGSDAAAHLLVEPSTKDVIVVGFTQSANLSGSTGAAQAGSGGGQDGFVARFDKTLATLVRATYVGGSGTDYLTSLLLHPTGSLIVAGGTSSPDLPHVSGGAQTALRGPSDAFVAALDPDLTSYFSATYLGGGAGEGAIAVALQDARFASSDIFVSGSTNSYDFPGTSGAMRTVSHVDDAFVARLTRDLSALEIATYVGGPGVESGTGMVVDPVSREVLIAARTFSPTMAGTAGAAQPAPGGISFPYVGDALVARLTPDLSATTAPIGLVPVNLVVDPDASATSDGDQILEPGETVVVAPFWKNIYGIPLTETGTATSFTGPAGATYSAPDTSAAYATVGAGATVNCASTVNCYSFGVGSTRPASHWDATFHETLSNGDAKTWTLHVGNSFTDVPRSQTFYKKIETILHNGITSGCTTTTYCPGTAVPRDQMAIFLAKVIAGGGANVPVTGQVNGHDYRCNGGLSGESVFTDVSPSDPACKHIHYIAAQNVTLGCSATQFCPTDLVNRDAMAAFLAKSYVAPNGGGFIPESYGPDPVTGLMYSCNKVVPNTHFTDVPFSDPFCKFVHYLWARGFVGGCSATAYCPADPVTRDAMAKFLVNTFDLKLYGP
ncbi:MAG TPA: hypothetical protein VMQ61_06675 [Thermoanaerobaculia bacterium]|nr:hypothetical protein [Thermoanaerobaculia bacterium]